ncbi:MAG: translation elongation factor Ts [Spirochaetia bacterium]|nr:translation elongation factor Ts [Spirochaetia bacterium]
MAIEPEKIKTLREMTSAGMLDCKKALEECGGDIEKAAEELRKKGIIKAVKKMDRVAGEGRFFSYVHHNGKIGVLVELNCETDFVAKNELFNDLGKNIAMHIAASAPQFIKTDEVPQDLIDKEREIQLQTLKDEGKPDNVIDKIMDGKLKKFVSELSLLTQAYVKEPSHTVEDIIKECISKLGENISIGRFIRYTI